MTVRSILIYPASLATYEESWISGHPKCPFCMPVAPKRDLMWYEILGPSFLSSLRTFYVKMAISEGGGVCISLNVIWPISDFYFSSYGHIVHKIWSIFDEFSRYLEEKKWIFIFSVFIRFRTFLGPDIKKDMQTFPPLRRNHLYIKEGECAESNEKPCIRFFRF